MNSLALRNPDRRTAANLLVPILIVLLLASVVTISARDYLGPILDLIAIITGLDDLIDSLNRSIVNLEKRLPGLESTELQKGQTYEKWVNTYNARDAEVKRVETELAAVNSKLGPLNAEIASLGRTIHACDQWLRYHPNASPSAKRNNEKIRADAVKERNAKRDERRPLFAERLRLQALLVYKKSRRSDAKYMRDSAKQAYDAAIRKYDNIVSEIATKKKKKADKEAERIDRRKRLSALQSANNHG